MSSSGVGLGQRVYPRLECAHVARRPISFVTVHFSNDLSHNLALSECVRDPANELIVVDNRNNLVHDTLGGAFEFGIAQARHELIALVHEDVLLLPGWQPAAERALAALERHDPDWAVAGVAGWCGDNTMRGHWSDPHGYYDRLDGADFAEVERIDEQIILFRRSGRIPLDVALPSIHNVGRDLPRMAAECGRRTYVVNAPTIHKYADAEGNRILCRADSPKIRARSDLTYLADLACSDLYYASKWNRSVEVAPAMLASDMDDRLGSPIILLAKGGGGSRLLSVLADDAGVYRGGELNASGDSLCMVQATYGAVLAGYRYRSAGLRGAFIAQLRRAAMELKARSDAVHWGYKLPESMLILDEIAEAFPSARFVHMLRDPLSTCLRRTHMTARFDSHVGQACLLAAYAATGRDVDAIRRDSPAVHMAVTTLHQVGTALDWTRRLEPERLLELRFEALLRDPADALQRLCSWIDPGVAVSRTSPSIFAAVDPMRAANPRVTYPPEVEAEVARILAPLRQRLGYLEAG